VDYAGPRGRLARLDAGEPPRDLDDEKLLVVARALRLRRECRECFIDADSTYAPLATSSGNALAFARGRRGTEPAVATLVTRLPVALQRHGGWDAHTVVLPTGDWTDVLTGRTTPGGAQRIADLLASLPVALLHRAG
jgi:(1->4)-alpha-D-glucan 1-alpha-D-glucosylmutase